MGKHDQKKIETPPSELLDLIESQTRNLSRNDSCHCGSGKKYKKCCLITNRLDSSASNSCLASFEIKLTKLTADESKDSFPPLSEEDEELIEELYYILKNDPKEIQSENSPFFLQLKELRTKYPSNPVILNYLSMGYQHLKMNDKLDELTMITYEKFPDYLFARIAFAGYHLNNDNPAKAFEIIGCYSLIQLYPNRNVFHISEFKAFECFLVNYFCTENNIEEAKIHCENLKKVLKYDDQILINAKEMVKSTIRTQKLQANLFKTFGKGKLKDIEK